MMVQTETRPADILILMCDQLNPHMVGYAGDPLAPTPNIDRLAAAGTVFTNAYTVSPVCMPSRACHPGHLLSVPSIPIIMGCGRI
jgi:arylsulfatase A-like enzyme